MKVIKLFGYTLRITKTRRATPNLESLSTREDEDRQVRIPPGTPLSASLSSHPASSVPTDARD